MKSINEEREASLWELKMRIVCGYGDDIELRGEAADHKYPFMKRISIKFDLFCRRSNDF